MIGSDFRFRINSTGRLSLAGLNPVLIVKTSFPAHRFALEFGPAPLLAPAVFEPVGMGTMITFSAFDEHLVVITLNNLAVSCDARIILQPDDGQSRSPGVVGAVGADNPGENCAPVPS